MLEVAAARVTGTAPFVGSVVGHAVGIEVANFVLRDATSLETPEEEPRLLRIDHSEILRNAALQNVNE